MKTLLALEVLEHKIRYIIIEDKAAGFAVSETGVHALEVGPSVPGALANWVKNLAHEKNLHIARLFLTVNRRDTLIHQLNLTALSSTDLDSIIRGEIDKIPSFMDRDFVYIHKQFETDKRNKTKVVFASITDELLQYLIQEVESMHIPCQDMEIAPLNLTGLLVAEEFKNSTQAVVVLSDKLTYLTIFENQNIKYIYTSHTGSEDLFTLGQANEAHCRTWAEELKRALKSFGLDNQGEVKQISLIWDESEVKGFDEYLRSTLNFDVKPLTLLSDLAHQPLNPIFLVAAVPAIYHVTKARQTFPLKHFFAQVNAAKAMQRNLVMATVVMGVLAFTFAIAGYYFHNVEQQAKADVQATNEEIVLIEKESPEVFKLRDEYTQTRNQLLAQATYVKLLNRMSWSEALSVVASELPVELSLTSFKVNEGGQATFTGEAFQMESVAKLLRQLETSAILEQGKFSYLNEQEVDKRKLFRFGILASMKVGEES